MLKRTVLSLPLLVLMMTPGAGFAQNQDASKTPESQKFYRLEFVVKEVEGGKVLNARAYVTTAAADLRESRTQIRAGGRVPYQTVTLGDSSKNPISAFQYLDVGVNIDCSNIKELARGLSLFVSADISSVPTDNGGPTTDSRGPVLAPTIRQNRWSSVTIVPLKKPTLIFSSDDPTTKRQMQLELTVTPIM